MKIVILGSTGMLGSTLGRYFLEKFGEDNVFLSYRNLNYAYGKNRFYFNVTPLSQYTYSKIPQSDYVINCVGVIKPFAEKNVENTILVNSVFPWGLADYCKRKGIKLLSITTDCVFSGQRGKYIETDFHDAITIYGKSKSLGESTSCLCLRTSIIGPEIHENVSLVAWLKEQKKGRVKGYLNAFWNGMTTRQYAKICEKIITENLYQEGLFHVFSPNVVSKYELLNLLNKRFQLDIEIESANLSEKVDLSLSTIKDLNSKLQIPSIQQQIEEM